MILTLTLLTPAPRIYLLGKGNPDDIEGFCKVLHILTKRDIDGTVTTVIRSMLIHSPDEPIGSSDLAELTNLKRVTIIHHLKRLEKCGVVQKVDHRYKVCPLGFEALVRKRRQEAEEMFDEAEELARRLDQEFEVNRRPILLRGSKNME
jgi:DNA-binding MarR family transcriptional regulator